MSFTYLASPYTHPDPKVREQRFNAAAEIAADLMHMGEIVFSPIAHSHPIDLYFNEPESGTFWKRQDEPFLMACSKMAVLMLPGWEESKGIAHEIEVAKTRGLEIEYISYEYP